MFVEELQTTKGNGFSQGSTFTDKLISCGSKLGHLQLFFWCLTFFVPQDKKMIP